MFPYKFGLVDFTSKDQNILLNKADHLTFWVFIHSSIDVHLAGFHILAIVYSAAMNIGCMYLSGLEFGLNQSFV